MRIIATVAVSVAALGLGMPGCTAEHASAIDVSESAQAVSSVADENDPYGACVLDETQTEGVFPGRCSNGGQCDGEADIGCIDDSELCAYGNFWMSCQHECEEDSDCPMPETGTSEPRCNNIGRCQLPCEAEGTVCPNGFMCWQSHGSSNTENFLAGINDKLCVQYFELESFALPSNYPW